MTTKPNHGDSTPFHIAHDLSDIPPLACDFKLGDRVIFTNPAGLKFAETVRAFSKQIDARDGGRFVYVFPDDSSWWFPVNPSSLQKDES